GTARADAGCYPDYAIDQDPAKEGVQASCTVSEVKIVRDASGKVTSETPVKQITEQCPEWKPGHEHAEHGEHGGKYPCWRPGYQPAVCMIGYSFTYRDGDNTRFSGPYTSEDTCKKDLKKKTEELKDAPVP